MVVVVLCILSAVILAYWLWFGFALANRRQAKSLRTDFPAVSVIVAYKNEAANIVTLVTRLLQQVYPGPFEMIAIDDYSEDNGHQLLQHIGDERLVAMQATQDLPGKKSALTEAINRSQYPFLLMIDGDCLPQTDQWMSTMMASMTADIDIVCGYAPLRTSKDFLGLWQRFETWLTAIQYMSYAISGHAYMAVGRNMLIRKAAFERVGGYRSHMHIAAGDDDLLVQAISDHGNVNICLESDSFVYSDAKKTVSSYLAQKSRHVGISHYYGIKHKNLLGIFAASQLGFWLVAICGFIIFPQYSREILIVICFKWMVQMVAHSRWLSVLRSKDLTYFFPLLDLLLPMYYIVSGAMSAFKKSSW
jgi:poly-beta-1,6-N-acetyl-D-glucosamine synthase